MCTAFFQVRVTGIVEDNSVNKIISTVLDAWDVEMYETGSSDQKKFAALKENVGLWDFSDIFRKALKFHGSCSRD